MYKARIPAHQTLAPRGVFCFTKKKVQSAYTSASNTGSGRCSQFTCFTSAVSLLALLVQNKKNEAPIPAHQTLVPEGVVSLLALLVQKYLLY
jgi:hypothetical protein